MDIFIHKETMFSTTTQYALRALAALGRADEGKPVLARDLAHEAEVPSNYLSKVLAQLVRAGVVRAARGTGGGYQLARSPSEIRLVEIVAPFEGVRATSECIFGGGRSCSDRAPCTAHRTWRTVRRAYIDFLQTTTLAAVAGHGHTRLHPRPKRSRRRSRG